MSFGIRLPPVKILDFGLARITDSDSTVMTMTTEIGVIKGTLAYMSPEQARGNQEAIDVRADVYALGVLLYEMLAGERPYNLTDRPLADAVRVICEETAPPLSRSVDGKLRFDEDVATVVGKALEKDIARRYGSALALSEDVSRYLSSQPILARPPSASYQLRKFAGRNKVLVGGIVATFVVLIAGVLVSTNLGLREARQRRAAQAARSEAERVGYVANIVAAEASLQLFDLAEVKRRLAACPPSLRGWEWSHLKFRSDMSEQVIRGHAWRLYAVAASPDGKLLASGAADPDTTVRIWDAVSGTELQVLKGHQRTDQRRAAVRTVAFAPDSKRLASGSDDATIRIWDVEEGRTLHVLKGHEDRVSSIVFSADGRELISGSWDGTVQRWNSFEGGEPTLIGTHDGRVLAVTACGDRSRIASSGADKRIRIWEVSRLAASFDLPGVAYALACSPDGKQLAAGLQDGTVRLLDSATGELLVPPLRHDDIVVAVDFHPGGGMLASAGKDRTVRLWDSATGDLLVTLVGHDDYVTSLAFRPDGKEIISGAADRTLRIWSANPSKTSADLAALGKRIDALQVTRDGSRIVVTSRDGFEIRRVEGGDVVATISAGEKTVQAAAVSQDGTLLAAAGGGVIRFWRIQPDNSVVVINEFPGDAIGTLRFVEGSSAILLGSSNEGVVERIDFQTGHRLSRYEISTEPVWTLEVSPDRSRMVTSHGRVIYLVDLQTGNVLARQELQHVDPTATGGSPALALTYSPDGRRIASAHAQDYTVRLWDAADLTPLATRQGHTEMVVAIAYNLDGTRIASSGWDYSVRLWDGSTGESLLALRTGRAARVRAVGFLPQGDDLISGDDLGFLTRWRTRPPASASPSFAPPLNGHSNPQRVGPLRCDSPPKIIDRSWRMS